ncbi:hypothetical protein [Symbiopectobacterium purcellii]|uniref:InvB/SpaK family type III secretion system chaperone n=1 Tax=Symbiopectobacterium purcellii TaxID=2871826 RepID=UPI003F844A5F
MQYDVVALLTEILAEVGMSEVLDKDLNNHSTISLHMKDGIPTIHIKSNDEEIWVWAQLGEVNLSTLCYCSANLFPLLLAHNEEAFHAGQPCLYQIDNSLDLRAQVKEKHCESASAFMEMLDTFLTVLQQYRTALN